MTEPTTNPSPYGHSGPPDTRISHSDGQETEDEDQVLARELIIAEDRWHHDPTAPINQIRLDNARAWLSRRLARDPRQ